MADVAEIEQILEKGEAARAAILADARYSESYRNEQSQAIRAEAIANARLLVQRLRDDAENAVRAAGQTVIDLEKQHESSFDGTRLVAAQNELSALARGSWEGFNARIERAVRLGDAHTLRAAVVGVQVLRERAASSELSPMRQRAGSIERMDREIAEHLRNLEPQPLQNARGRFAETLDNAKTLDWKIQSINQRTAKGGGPGLFGAFLGV